MTITDRIRLYDQKYSGDPATVCRRIFVHDRSHCAQVNDDVLFNIRSFLSDRLSVPLNCVLLTGSAHTGLSLTSRAPFSPKDSDLDFAIVSSYLFQLAISAAINATKAYTDETLFDSPANRDHFHRGTSIGMIRPQVMPKCTLRENWQSIERTASSQAITLANRATLAVYLSEHCFTSKQRSAIKALRNQTP